MKWVRKKTNIYDIAYIWNQKSLQMNLFISLWFQFVFPCWWVRLSIFSCACSPGIGKIPIQILCWFLNQGFFFFFFFWYLSSLYFLDIKPLLYILLANIFSHSVGCLYILLIVSFSVQKLLSLMLIDVYWCLLKLICLFLLLLLLPEETSKKYRCDLCQKM